jgi:hypothetical protein
MANIGKNTFNEINLKSAFSKRWNVLFKENKTIELDKIK